MRRWLKNNRLCNKMIAEEGGRERKRRGYSENKERKREKKNTHTHTYTRTYSNTYTHKHTHRKNTLALQTRWEFVH
jgi:hypothetical protein